MAALMGACQLMAGCSATPVVPATPTWADAAPVIRGACASCHGWTARDTGGGYRLDFFDASTGACGDAALALDSSLLLAGSALAAAQIKDDLVRQGDAQWPRMPPQPSPALVDWQRDTLLRWANQPTKGPPPTGNRAPTIAVSQLPATADKQLAFTAILDDPDGDSVIGVINVAGLSFLMNRPGSFAVAFDAATWPAGPQPVSATVCDGWSSVTFDLGPVQVQH